MIVGIIGLPQAGKKTVFELLTGVKVALEKAHGKEEIGIAPIRDERFDKLVSMYNPKKKVPATIEFIVLPKIEKESIKKGDAFKPILKVDAILHVVRAFKDEAIFHIDGSVDPKRDIETVANELILNDLIFVEKRLERLEKDLKGKKDPLKEKEKELLIKIKAQLENNFPLRAIEFSDEEKKILSAMEFLTRKKIVIALNVGEEELKNKSLIEDISKAFKDNGLAIMMLSAKVEKELESFESIDEKEAFMKELGIEESALSKLTKLCFEALGLISFFTVGEDEVRQWMVRKNSTAPEAAGVIHSDLERGFIRAEVMKCQDLIKLGGEDKVKTAGKLLIKGKDYIVEDGDILNIRFNV